MAQTVIERHATESIKTVSRGSTTLFVALVAAQMIGLVAFAIVKQNAVATGTEVVLQAVPVDPRSLLQGDYVVLDYQIARVPEPFSEQYEPGDDAIVTLEKNGLVWVASRYFAGRGVLLSEGETYIHGIVGSDGRIDFGIGTYFVPEGTGHIVERARDLKVRVSLSGDGDATVTGVIVDGEDFSP